MAIAMKDRLIDTLHERFTGHEMDVDPGAWQAIQTQMAVQSGATLRETLQQKFSGHEAHVDPGVWQQISSQLGHGAAAGTAAGTAGWWAAGVAATALVGGLVWYGLTDRSTPAPAPGPAPAQVQPAPAPAHEVAAAVHVQAATTPTATLGTKSATNAAPATQHPMKAVAAPGAVVVNDVLQKLVEHVDATPQFPEKDKAEYVPPVSTPPQVPDPAAPANGASTMAMNGHATTSAAKGSEPGSATATDPGEGATAPAEPPAPATQDFVAPPAPELYIPNVFSPQGDGINDKLAVTGKHYQKVDVRIFSATTNAVVFKANNLDEQWNGRDLTGAQCEEGYYFYAVEVQGEDGRTYSKGEVVKLFR